MHTPKGCAIALQFPINGSAVGTPGIPPNPSAMVRTMAIRANLAATWAVLAAVALWLRARTTERVGLSPVSSDWLLDLERKSIRGQF